MKNSLRMNIVTNLILFLVVVAVGAVCFFPLGVSTAGKLSDRVYYGGDRESSYVSLMFNVYGGDDYLPSILDTLDKYEVKATFFFGGCWADDHGGTVKEIADRGHEIANHGYFHKDQDKLSFEANKAEIETCGALLKTLTGRDILLFAPPSGAYSEKTVDAADVLGYKVIMWSKDTIDWRDKDENLIYKRATENVKSGDLILMHPTECTAKALDAVLQRYKDLELKQVPVSVNIGTQQI